MFSHIFLKTFNAFLKKFQKHFQDRVVVTNLLTKPLWLTRKDNKILIMEGRNEMLSKTYTGGPRIVRIQTVRFHYSAENFLVPSIRFYTEISAIPRYSAIFS